LSIFFLSIITINSFSQLNLEKMIHFKLGTSFKDSQRLIQSIFSQKPTISKSDFLGAYRIEYENLPFGYYGDASYTFQFVKDTLALIKVEFLFYAPDTLKFQRLFITLNNDLNNLRSLKRLEPKDVNFTTDMIFNYVNRECITNTRKDDRNYKPINIKNLGGDYFYKNTDNGFTQSNLYFYTYLYETHITGSDFNYNGGVVAVALEYSWDSYSHLIDEERNLQTASYSTLKESADEINLNFKNGVYYVPLKINNTITIQFIIDLGASDVSISPDIFNVLYKAGTIEDDDFFGTATYQLADGTTVKSNIFNIKEIQIGNNISIKNVRASISNSVNSPLLLGQSFFTKLKGYRIDNIRRVLIIE
jgi:predicted aspartyl protease